MHKAKEKGFAHDLKQLTTPDSAKLAKIGFLAALYDCQLIRLRKGERLPWVTLLRAASKIIEPLLVELVRFANLE